MPKLTVRKCPFTHKIFETDRKYKNHLLKLRKVRNKVRADTRLRRETRERMDALAANIRTAADLEKFIVEHFQDLLIASHGTSNLTTIRRMKMEWFRFDRISYSDKARNTHCCPRGGQTNFSCKDDLPRGYPGFSGQMSWKATGPKGADQWNVGGGRIEVGPALRYLGVHTGTGCPGWDGNISFEWFVSDFPGVEAEIARVREEAKLEIFHARLKNSSIVEQEIIHKHIRPIATTQKELDKA